MTKVDTILFNALHQIGFYIVYKRFYCTTFSIKILVETYHKLLCSTYTKLYYAYTYILCNNEKISKHCVENVIEESFQRYN